MSDIIFSVNITPDWEVQETVCECFGLLDGVNIDDPHFLQKREVQIQRFLGYDYVRQGVNEIEMLCWSKISISPIR